MYQRTFFLRSHQSNARLAMTSTATTGPAITPGLIPPFDAEEGLGLHWIVGHCEHVLAVSHHLFDACIDGQNNVPRGQDALLVRFAVTHWITVARHALPLVPPSLEQGAVVRHVVRVVVMLELRNDASRV
jgi:hypothetical protein